MYEHEEAITTIQHNAVDVKNTELDFTENLKCESVHQDK